MHDLNEIMDIYYDDPVAFAEDMLNIFTLDPWQKEHLMDLTKYTRLSTKSGQGVGKTYVEAIAAVWYLATRPDCRVVCTAPTRQQLIEVLWAELASVIRESLMAPVLEWTATKVYMKGQKMTWFATAKTSNRPENMQGFHSDYMLFIVDEASGVSSDVLEAIQGTLTGFENILSMYGNPTKTSGTFFESHHGDAGAYKTRTINSEDSPRTSEHNIATLKKKYGEDSDVYRVRVKGDFPRGEPDAFISLSSIAEAQNRELPPGYQWGNNRDHEIGKYELLTIPHDAEIAIGVDVARFGGDETVIATRTGLVSWPLESFMGQNLMQTVGQVLIRARQLAKTYGRTIRIVIDDTGIGGGVTDRLNEVLEETGESFDIVPVNFASKGNDFYEGIVSLMYGHFKEEILDEVVLPKDDEMTAQFSVRRYKVVSKGRIKIESKDELKRRKFPSPDRAEAVILSYHVPLFNPKQDKINLGPPSIGALRRSK